MGNKENSCNMKKCSIGGQALIEGIMMRGPKISAMAVRNPKGEMVIEEWENKVAKRPKFCKLPLVRGVFGFIDSMIVGYKALMRSAEIAIDEEEEEAKKAEKKAKKNKKKDTEAKSKDNKKSNDTFFGIVMGIASVLGTIFAVLLFAVLPSFIYYWLENILPFLPIENAAANSLVKSAYRGR